MISFAEGNHPAPAVDVVEQLGRPRVQDVQFLLPEPAPKIGSHDNRVVVAEIDRLQIEDARAAGPVIRSVKSSKTGSDHPLSWVAITRPWVGDTGDQKNSGV